MSASRTEVERRRDQAQRDRAMIAQNANDRQDEVFPFESLFPPPSKVKEENTCDENDDTTRKIESILGPWENFTWESGNPVVKQPEQTLSGQGRSPVAQNKSSAAVSSSHTVRLNGEHKHPAHTRTSGQSDDHLNQNNHLHSTNSHHRSESAHRCEDKSGSLERSFGSAHNSLTRVSQKNVRHSTQSCHSSQPLSQGISVSPKSKLSCRHSTHDSSSSPKGKPSSLSQPGDVPAKQASSPHSSHRFYKDLPGSVKIESDHHHYKDLPGSVKIESDHHHYKDLPGSVKIESDRHHYKDLPGSVKIESDHHHYKDLPGSVKIESDHRHYKDLPGSVKIESDHHHSSNGGMSQVDNRLSCSSGPRTPPFQPPSQEVLHRTPPPTHCTSPVASFTTPLPHQTPPPSHHRTLPLSQKLPHSQNATCNARSHTEIKPNLTLNIERKRNSGDLDDIFKEMEMSLSTPVTALSETPVKCKKAPSFKFAIKSEDEDYLKLKPLVSPLREPDTSHVSQPSPSQAVKLERNASGSSSDTGNESDSSSGSDSSTEFSGNEFVGENEKLKDDKKVETPEQSKPVNSADAPDQKPSGEWGLRRFIPSPVSVPSNTQNTSKALQSKVNSDEDFCKENNSTGQTAGSGPCETMPFSTHFDSDLIPRNSEKASISPDTMSTASSHASSLDISKTDKNFSKENGACDVTSGNKASVMKQNAVKTGLSRPKSTSVTAKTSLEGDSVKVVVRTVDGSRTPTQQQKCRKLSSGASKLSQAANSSSSDVDIESMSPPKIKQSAAPTSNSDISLERLETDEGRQLFKVSLPSIDAASSNDKKLVSCNRSKTLTRHDSSHNSKMSSTKYVSQDGGESVDIGIKFSSHKTNTTNTLTDIGSIMKDMKVPQLLSPTIPSCTETSGRWDTSSEPVCIPTCGKPSIVIRIHLARLGRLPQSNLKGGNSRMARKGCGNTLTASYSVSSDTKSGLKGTHSNDSTASQSLPDVKSGGKRKAGTDCMQVDSSLSSLPCSAVAASPSVTSLNAKRKKEEDASKDAKQQKSSHIFSSISNSARTVTPQPDMNGVAYSEEAKKACGKRMSERRGSASSSSSRCSHKSQSKKLKLDGHSDSDLNTGVLPSEDSKVNGIGGALPFNSYSQNVHQPSAISKPVPTLPVQPLLQDVDVDPLAVAQTRLESQDFYMQKAKELKHIADKMNDKPNKQMQYVKSVLYFIMWGHAYEKQPASLVEPHCAFTIYCDTLKLLSHVNRMHLAGLQDTERDRILSVLILRIQSLLCLKLYNFRKTEVMKLKKVIDSDPNKGSSIKMSAHAPSPHQNHWNKNSTGTPSPISPTPSPACSIGSVESQGSCEQPGSKVTNGNLNNSAMSSPATIAVPQRIHSVTQKYLLYTNDLVQCHDYWDQSDAGEHAHHLHGFFKNLDNRCGPLSLHSSMPGLVTYVHFALKQLGFTNS